ncbi:DUF2975 domain-containing protein [Kribbella antibiotica]|uniref:DUF2975 domain-containing protein n=1 Tax=Kribbella antibiotica TaxID=190195 RepID=A0A4V2YMA8_9ACTN|nr:DUF2975 domain-containing protein [Kribbella antibiotica]TDD49787.1 DUF2975 domain-containing protein [Kribbella antibiotica]
MLSENRAVAALRVFLVVLFAILVVFQTLSLPGQFRHQAEVNPNDADLRWPATFVAAFVVLCIQVVVVATWQLLTMVKRDRIFTPAATFWVNLIIGAIGGVWLVVGTVFLLVVLNADDPGLPMVLLLLEVVITVLGLLLVVMRALLQRATTLHTDMEAVI